MSKTIATRCTAQGEYDTADFHYICEGALAWAEAVVSGETSALTRIIADDFIGVDAQGRQYRKAALIQHTAQAPKVFKSNQIDAVFVRFYGCVAVAQGSESWERWNGECGRFIWTDTWLRRDGWWQIIAAQDVTASA